MTDTNTTPAAEANEHAAAKEIVDGEGNPIENKEETNTEQNQEDGQTVESLQKALKDTKAELTKLQQAKAEEDKSGEGSEEQETDDNKEEKDEVKEEAVAAGVDFDALSNEYNTNGELSAESYADLEKKGFPKQVVDDYIAGQVARNDKQTEALGEVVGGIDNLPTVLEWAGENLTPEEITAYNKVADTGSFAEKKLALQGIQARYSEAEGVTPNLVSGSQTQNAAGDVFKSAHAMTKAMEDQRYWTDPDYRAEVTAKVERSYKAGTI